MKIKLISLCLAVVILATCLAACANPTDTGSGSATASTSGGNNDEKVARFRMDASLTSLDWEQTTNTRDMKVWHQMYEGLYGMDEANGGYYKELAQDVQLSDDLLSYTIKLVPGVKFQNGDALNASDVEFSYKRAMKNPKFNYLTSMIEDIEAVDDSTVKVTLNKPYSPIDHTFFCIKILCEREVLEQGDKFGTIPHKAATGPYYVTDYQIATITKMSAFEDYWRGAPNIKKLEFLVIPDAAAATVAYANGQINYLEDAPLADWDSLKETAGESCAVIKGNNIQLLAVNNLSPTNGGVLGNEKVRQAIFYAINKEDINIAVGDGYGTPAYQYMPSDYVPTSPVSGFETYDYNVEKAKALLVEAGYPDGLDAGTLITYNANNAKMATVVQANLAEVGIKIEVNIAENAIQTPKMYVQEYDLAIFQDSGNYDYNNIRQQVHSESVGMYLINFKGSGFNWQRLEELVDLGAKTSVLEERLKYYTELWSIVMDTATINPCLHRPVGIVWSNDLDIGEPVPTYYKVRQFSWK